MKIRVIQTDEFQKDLKAYCLIFNEVFSTSFTPEYFLNKYSGGINGYSIHSVAYEDGRIIGSFSIIPQNYKGESKIKIGLGCDAFVIPDKRSDELLLFKLFKEIIPSLQKNEIKGIISIPNPKAVKYWKYIAKWETIDFIKIQAIPVNYKNTYLFTRIYLYLALLTSRIFERTIQKYDEIRLIPSSHSLTYRYPKEEYNKLKSIYYRQQDEGHLNVMYLFNHSSLKRNSDLLSACLKLAKNNKNLDFIMIGSNKSYFGFITVPKKLIKRDFPIMIFSIEKSFKDIFVNNFNIDLGSFDNR